MRHRIKTLIEEMPENTNEVKRKIVKKSIVSRQTLWRILNDDNYVISSPTAMKFAKFFGVTVEQMFHNENKKSKLAQKLKLNK